jgi:hypothetical protein
MRDKIILNIKILSIQFLFCGKIYLINGYKELGACKAGRQYIKQYSLSCLTRKGGVYGI